MKKEVNSPKSPTPAEVQLLYRRVGAVCGDGQQRVVGVMQLNALFSDYISRS